MQTDSIIILVVNAFISIVVCLITCFAQKQQLKQEFKNEIESKYNEIKKDRLLNEINTLKSKFIKVVKLISDLYLKTQFPIGDNAELDADSLEETYNSIVDYQYSIYENNLFMKKEIHNEIKKGHDFLVNELSKYLSLDSKNKDELNKSSNSFNDKSEEYINKLASLLEKEFESTN